jgi:hypothetical protein
MNVIAVGVDHSEQAKEALRFALEEVRGAAEQALDETLRESLFDTDSVEARS